MITDLGDADEDADGRTGAMQPMPSRARVIFMDKLRPRGAVILAESLVY